MISSITPPPELVRQWINDAFGPDYEQCITTAAARWGADQELEACCEWMRERGLHPEYWRDLRAARRPKALSLKEQALEALNSFEGFTGSLEEVCIIRRVLETLPND